MKLAWLTDIHLNFLTLAQRKEFYAKIIASKTDMILISGDIAEAPCLSYFLAEMLAFTKRPIHFVLGNHDYYFDEIETVRNEVKSISQSQASVFWLGMSNIRIANDIWIVGVDGWADGRYGNFERSHVWLNDYNLIDDYRGLQDKDEVLHKMQTLADDEARRLKFLINDIFEGDILPSKVIILTHIPPFPEVCKYGGLPTDDDHLPFYASKATGDALIEIATLYPETQFLVLCGHTHGKAKYTHPLHPNLTVKTGGAEYNAPKIQEIIEV